MQARRPRRKPKSPLCGFSAKAAQAVMACGEKFAYVDILQNPEIRANLPKYANWPTFPQLWVGGELVGGSDIMTEMAADGSLQATIKAAVEAAAANKSEA
jgi:monothiol glutaredoxin